MNNKIKLQIIFLICFLFMSCANKTSYTNLNGKWIDLTHDFSDETIYWPTSDPFELKTIFKGPTKNGYYYEANKYCTAEHGGTHVDAPIHFAFDKKTVDQIPIDQLIGDGIVVDVSNKALPNPDYQVVISDFKDWEDEYEEIPNGAIILLRTGYGKFWPDRSKYMGTKKRGPEGVKELSFPGLHPDAAKWLVEYRDIKAIGLDTPSIDYGRSVFFKSHQTLFEANIPAFENVANLDKLPPNGFHVFALPMKIKGGSGSPLRIVAFINN